MAFIGNGAQLTDLDAGDIATGTVATARLASGTASASTYLRGDQTWAAISSSPPALSSTFPLKSAASLAAGRIVNINSSGEVGDYPVVNSLGTLVTNTGGYAYNQFSTNGSRAVRLTIAEPQGGNYVYTIRGMAITGSGFTNGTVTVTSSVSLRGGQGGGVEQQGYNIIPINGTDFLIFIWLRGYSNNNNETFTQKRRIIAYVVTVDSSGNCTKGTENTIFSRDSPESTPEGDINARMYRFVNGLFGVYAYTGNNASTGTRGYFLSISGTTITSTQDNDFYNYYGSESAGANFGQVTSGGIAVQTGAGDNSTYLYKATWNGSALGTVTNENLFPLGGRVTSLIASPTLLVAVNADTSNVIKIVTFTINQSTGAATLYASRILDNTFINAPIYLNLTAESSTKYVLSLYNASKVYAYSFEINSSGDILGTGIRLLTDLTSGAMNPTYTGSSNTYRFADDDTKTQDVVVNSYNTPGWNSLGASETAQNTSPATIVTDGVASGFTGLTPGTTYYVNTVSYDGTVTATPNAFPVGLAVSSTEISLGV